MFQCLMVLRKMNNYLTSIIEKCGSIKALLYLRLLSFIESIFFPIPTDVLIAPMVLSGKHNWIKVSSVASIWSVIGGIVGYYLGYFLFDTVEPFIHAMGKYDQYLSAKSYFEVYGITFLFIAAFTPIPYKVFTISAGVLNYSLPIFVLVSLIGRSARFFLVSFVCLKYGNQILDILNKYLLYLAVFVIIVIYLISGV